ncbi:hypothetical protein RhiirA4_484102 [Rhizophagus irregularis]|uniref:Uncharacterized protein n=1 Tax=Rhizophagus irregularis TaxID=588596 RepID=A0A2I1HNF7_9GLOM|nr:hypothetical protein RhiirA4_484102 [Rhizophagus irregularis]
MYNLNLFLVWSTSIIIGLSVNLSKSTPNFILHDKEIYGLKSIYDLQLESISKNIIYQSNGNYKLKTLFKIKFLQEQKRIWTAKCPGEMEFEEYRGKHCWIRDAINLLKSEDMCLCIHETKDKEDEHRIKGRGLEIIDFLTKKEIKLSANSKRKKGIIFLPQLLEGYSVHPMKWKHFIMEKEVIEDQMTRRVKDKYLCGEKNLKEIHLKLFDEEEKIGYHMVVNNDIVDLDNSPELVKCSGCEKNVTREYVEYDINDEFYNWRIDLIDKLIETDENFIKFLKNSLIEEEKKGMRREEIFLLVENIKIRNRMEENGKRSYEYILNILIRKNYNSDKEELKFSVRYDDNLENEFKVIIRGIILGILIIDRGSDVGLGVNSYVLRLLENFKNSKNEFLFLSSLDKIRLKLREELVNNKAMMDSKSYKMKFIDEVMSFDEFNLYWKKILISGGLRAWRKKCSELIWKNEMLNSSKVEDLFYYNYKDEFDWNKTLQFISNRNIYISWEIEKDDVWERSYKIKNFLKDLPTYEVLYKRDVNKIETDQCIRCKNGVEDWDHLWICETNELTIKEVLKLSISNFEEILLGKEKYWELIRGVYNRKFNTLSKDKDEKEVINELWIFCFNALKNEFWNKRCNEVNEIEQSLGIKKSDKRVRKFIDWDMKCEDKSIENQRKKLKISEKYKNREQNIKLVTKNKIISRFTEGKNTKNWKLIGI